MALGTNLDASVYRKIVRYKFIAITLIFVNN